MFKQALALLPLCAIFGSALPGPKADARETAATCTFPAEILCCAELDFVRRINAPRQLSPPITSYRYLIAWSGLAASHSADAQPQSAALESLSLWVFLSTSASPSVYD